MSKIKRQFCSTAKPEIKENIPMHNAKTLAEFHFDTEKSGEILRSFLADGRISNAGAAKALGYSYDTINDNLRGKIKEAKMDFVVKVCAITGHTLAEWCERMLDGVNEEVANTVRLAFGIVPGVAADAAIENVEVVPVPQPVTVVAATTPETPSAEEPIYLSQTGLTNFIYQWSETQEKTMARYNEIHLSAFEELRTNRDMLRQQYEGQIAAMRDAHDKERAADQLHFDNERKAYEAIIKRLEAELERADKRNKTLSTILSKR